LVRVARNVIRYDPAERTLEDISTFVAHRLVYGSPAVMKVVERYISREEFRKALAKTPKLYDLLSARFDFVVH